MTKAALVVDDERNIRLGLTQVLEELGLDVDTAVNGEEALERIASRAYTLMLLDLRMPGMDGMEVLRKMRDTSPKTRVVIITAYGTIESAVEAMKLGAIDFLQKPFAPQEIRRLVNTMLSRESLEAGTADSYEEHLQLAKLAITERHFDLAAQHLRQALSVEPERAEAFNLLGALDEIAGNRIAAIRNYRAALALDPTYEPARTNLNRATTTPTAGAITLGDGGFSGDEKGPSAR